MSIYISIEIFSNKHKSMDNLIEERDKNGVVMLTLNRPKALNALDLPLRQALSLTFTRLAEDADIGCVIITGSDRAFAAGADMRLLAQASPMEVQKLNLHRYWKSIADFPKPIIAAVRGFALGGGCELALHADIVIAGRSAKFGQPEVRLGIMPGAGGTQRLVRLIGSKRAMRLLLTAEIISADTAYDWGLVSKLVEDEDVIMIAQSIATLISEMPRDAIAHIKETVTLGQEAPLSTALALERRAFNMLFDTPQQKDHMAAFIKKHTKT